jgi:biotin carboxylase
MNVIFLSPGYPSEMPHFVRGLAQIGARVLGVGDQPYEALPHEAQRHLSAYLAVPAMWDEVDVVRRVREWLGNAEVARVESLSEYSVLLAARLREALGVPGMGVETVRAFRDKVRMKEVLDAAGLRTPRHQRANTAKACWEAAERIGYPLILKPIDGAGSAHTYRVETPDELRKALTQLAQIPEVSVEEFIDGEEYTFDALTAKGQVLYHNIAWYRPRPLVARTLEWVSPQVIALRDVGGPELAGGTEMGLKVLKALGFESGFTHMEWYRKADGEVVFGEIGARPPGARQVDQMNYACDFDSFAEWARIVCYGVMEATIERKYNVATIFKRAQGQGRIHHIEGLDLIRRELGPALVWENLLPVGAERRNWLQTLVSDGFILLRHPDLQRTLELADLVGTRLHLYAS